MSVVAPHTAAVTRTLIDVLLDEQRDLSAVKRFARWHESVSAKPVQARHYHSLIPLQAPAPGEQYAFEVDLDRCSGCKACVTACHALNGLDDQESWRKVGLLVGPDARGTSDVTPLLQHVTTACHHCVEPGCLLGCPVLAYDKDPVTGIVRHLDDQCIGCTYCVMTCPYEVPQFSRRLGIVRKCDMCHGRLAAGEAPACVQACPTEAIRISTVPTQNLVQTFRQEPTSPRSNAFLSGSPNPAITIPTTRYVTRRFEGTAARRADECQLAPAHSHWQLIGFLLLTQLSAGVLSVGTLLANNAAQASRMRWTVAAALAQVLALAVATLHLGKPFRAWRAFLGWRTSWFSREVMIFGLYTAVVCALPFLQQMERARGVLATAGVLIGWGGVMSSAALYAVTRRAYWNFPRTSLRFVSSAMALGAGALLVLSNGLLAPESKLPAVAITLAGIIGGLAGEIVTLAQGRSQREGELRRSATLVRGPLKTLWTARVMFAALATVLFLALPFLGYSIVPAVLGYLSIGVGICLERHLFFTAVAPDRMPGGVAP